MKKFTKELGPGWITLVENDDYALCRLIFVWRWTQTRRRPRF